MDTKIPDAIKKTPRCPLCHAMMIRQHNEMVQQRLEVMVAEALAAMKGATNEKELFAAKRRGEMLEFAMKRGAAEVFLCHHCRIGCAANDPFAGRWEQAYAIVGKEPCPACDTEMRFFCTATGTAILDCPAKKCRARIKRSLPDRTAAPQGEVLVDGKGDPIFLPNIDRAISTPDQMSDAQLGAAPDSGLPTVNIPMPKEGHA